MSDEFASNKTIESHSSYLTNRSVAIWFDLIDNLGFAAANSLHINKVVSYFNALDQLYLGKIVTILSPDIQNGIEKIRKAYFKLMQALEENPKLRTKRSLKVLLDLVKLFNANVVSGLQEKQFFFRVGARQIKGLKNIHFMSNYLFANGEKKENDTADFE